MSPFQRWHAWTLAGALLALIAWAYWPGLFGPFLFDDYSNLDVLGAHGPIRDWSALLYYLSSGNADPTGRPVALLSFLLDARDWPADPFSFKRTNLLLHLLNAALLVAVVTRLQAALAGRRPDMRLSPWTPCVAAALWGAHPFFVSTTLYVVQREAMLPMTFVLLAILAWAQAVSTFSAGLSRSGWTWAIAGFGGATVLAGLSKANGFLAPLLVGLAHLYFLKPARPADSGVRDPLDAAATACLLLPSLLVLFYLAYAGWHLWPATELAGRDWTLPERLMSEPRALWSYLGRLALPRAGVGGVYVDDFPVSSGWLDPASTLPAMVCLAAGTAIAIAWRQRFPIASFAWLFFLAAHLLESSTIPLELYFEHRNYLPAMFLGWPLAHALLRPGAYPRYRGVLALLLLAMCLLLTRQRALVWGNPGLLGALTAQYQPGSNRSQVDAAAKEFERGDTRAALQRIGAAQLRDPGSVDIAITAIGMQCRATGSLEASSLARASRTLTNAERWNYGLYKWLQDAVQDPATRDCHGFGLAGVRTLALAAEANPRTRSVPGRLRDVWHVRGRIALAEGDLQGALQWFDSALRLKPDPEYALVQAASLGDAGAPALGVRHLDEFERLDSIQATEPIRDMFTLHAWLLRHNGYYRSQVMDLRRQLQADADSRPPHGGLR
jgi:hypothetical protein